MKIAMYGCTTEVAEPVNVGVLTVPAGVPALTVAVAPLNVWSLGCVTECVNVAEGFPDVTALFVTAWVSVADGPPVTRETPVDVLPVTSFGVAVLEADVWIWLAWSATATLLVTLWVCAAWSVTAVPECADAASVPVPWLCVPSADPENVG